MEQEHLLFRQNAWLLLVDDVEEGVRAQEGTDSSNGVMGKVYLARHSSLGYAPFGGHQTRSDVSLVPIIISVCCRCDGDIREDLWRVLAMY